MSSFNDDDDDDAAGKIATFDSIDVDLTEPDEGDKTEVATDGTSSTCSGVLILLIASTGGTVRGDERREEGREP